MGTPTLTEQAYTRIQRAILDGRLPLGARVSEISLAKRLEIGRMPVREAIRRLQDEGILEQVSRFGTIVRRPERRDIVEVYELREALETYAVGQAARRIEPDQVRQLTALCERMHGIARDLKEADQPVLTGEAMQHHLAADKAFHVLLIHAGGNRRIVQAVLRMRVLTQIFSTHVMKFDADFLNQAYQYHHRILEAVQGGDAPQARQAIAEHIRAGLQQMLKYFDRQDQQSSVADEVELPPDVLDTLETLSTE